MGYVHNTGGGKDFGDKETEEGKGRADDFDRRVEEDKIKARELYNKDSKEWNIHYKEIKQENKKREKEWKEDCSPLWQKILLDKAKWEEECKKIKRKYEKECKKWEEECQGSIIGFLKKVLKINKPKLELPEKPPEKPDLPKRPELKLLKPKPQLEEL